MNEASFWGQCVKYFLAMYFESLEAMILRFVTVLIPHVPAMPFAIRTSPFINLFCLYFEFST